MSSNTKIRKLTSKSGSPIGVDGGGSISIDFDDKDYTHTEITRIEVRYDDGFGKIILEDPAIVRFNIRVDRL